MSPRRPLSSATAALRRGSPSRSRHGTELLPELLDFEGAVQLAQALDTPPAAATTSWSAGDAVGLARRRLEAVERDVRRPLVDPLTGAALIDAERVGSALERAGVPAVRQRKAIATAARELFAPVETQMLRKIAAVRRVVAEVRREIAPTLTATAPHAARLEQLDAALASATSTRTDALFSRAIAAMREAFASSLETAVLALPKGCDELPITAWIAPRGALGEHVARSEGFVLATFLHERARLDMLVRHTLGERLA